jgi:hypothetical protein
MHSKMPNLVHDEEVKSLFYSISISISILYLSSPV